MEIFQHLQHIKDLKLGTCFLEFLSGLEDSVAQSLPLLINKCLTLHHPDFNEHTAGIALALYYSHLLKKLVITKFFPRGAEFPSSEEENYWSLDLNLIKCLESHRKCVEFLSFSRRDPNYEQVLNFIEFVLRNAKVLEKLVVVFEKDDEDFKFEVSLALCCFRRCSPLASVELLHFV